MKQVKACLVYGILYLATSLVSVSAQISIVRRTPFPMHSILDETSWLHGALKWSRNADRQEERLAQQRGRLGERKTAQQERSIADKRKLVRDIVPYHFRELELRQYGPAQDHREMKMGGGLFDLFAESRPSSLGRSSTGSSGSGSSFGRQGSRDASFGRQGSHDTSLSRHGSHDTSRKSSFGSQESFGLNRMFRDEHGEGHRPAGQHPQPHHSEPHHSEPHHSESHHEQHQHRHEEPRSNSGSSQSHGRTHPHKENEDPSVWGQWLAV